MYNAIYHKVNNGFVDVAQKLAEEKKIEPVYWIGNHSSREKVTKRFPNILFHLERDSLRGIRPKELQDINLLPLDQDTLHQLSKLENVILKMMSRFDFGRRLPYEERLGYYHYHLKYWLTVFELFKPDIFVTREAPHLAHDYILYCLCNLKGIKTIYFHRTFIQGFNLTIRNMDFDYNLLSDAYKNEVGKCCSQVVLSDVMKAYYNKMQGSYSSAMPDYMKTVYKSEGAKKQIKDSNNINRIDKLLKNPKKIKKLPSMFKRKLLRYFKVATPVYYISKSDNLFFINLAYYWYKFKIFITKKRLHGYYNKLCSKNEIDLEKPYVFAALHLQPERSTIPEGDIFADQLLMIDLLANALPEDWFLYVKENPKQFKVLKKEQGNIWRNYAYYNHIVSYKNVKLVPVNIEPFELIDKAKAVATVTGTAGWEAVLRGKPALVFGNAWYKDCEGVFYTPTLQKCKEALQAIKEGYVINETNLKLFISTIEKIAIKASFLNRGNPLQIGHEESVSRIAEEISKTLN